jgi:hypothetical protein
MGGSALLKERLAQIFMRMNAENDAIADKERACHDFVFHMTDWVADLERLSGLYAHPEAHDEAHAREAVTSFLYHASGHIAEAARIFDVFIDPFGKANETK